MKIIECYRGLDRNYRILNFFVSKMLFLWYQKDSLRFYYLGKSYKTKIEHYGKDLGCNVDDTLIL